MFTWCQGAISMEARSTLPTPGLSSTFSKIRGFNIITLCGFSPLYASTIWFPFYPKHYSCCQTPATLEIGHSHNPCQERQPGLAKALVKCIRFTYIHITNHIPYTNHITNQKTIGWEEILWQKYVSTILWCVCVCWQKWTALEKGYSLSQGRWWSVVMIKGSHLHLSRQRRQGEADWEGGGTFQQTPPTRAAKKTLQQTELQKVLSLADFSLLILTSCGLDQKSQTGFILLFCSSGARVEF